MAKLTKVKNTGGGVAEFTIAGSVHEPPEKFRLKPGETCEIPAAYAVREELPNGRILDSVIENLTGGRVRAVTLKVKPKDDKSKEKKA